MHAAPIIPGEAYRVTFAGHSIDVLASHGCAAICAVLALLEVLPC